MEHGERRVMERGETLEEAGEPAQWVAYVERGCFQVHGAQRRGEQGLLHGLRLRGRVRVRLPLLPRRRRVGGEHLVHGNLEDCSDLHEAPPFRANAVKRTYGRGGVYSCSLTMTIVILRKVEALRPARPAIRAAGLFRIVGLLSRGGFGEIAPSEFMRHLEAQKQG